MKKLYLLLLFCCGIVLATPVQALQPALTVFSPPFVQTSILQIAPPSPLPGSGTSPQPSSLQPFDEVIKDTEKSSGLFTLYRHSESGKVYLEIHSNQLDRNFLMVPTLDSGVGELGLFRGWPLRDFIFQFRRVQNQVQVVVPNTNFRLEPGDPQQRSIERSFSDSILSSLPIRSIHPQRQTLLVEINDLFVGGSDLAGLLLSFPWVLGEQYVPDSTSSYIRQVQAFPQNVEIATMSRFLSSGETAVPLETLPDPRAFSLGVRYSLSELPTNRNGYRPRLADERLGYFVTAYQNLSSDEARPPFVRYIQRWHLEPQDPTAPLSPPKKPIVFWIENTVPALYRQAIQEGVLMWNQAFEQAGFKDAIEVRQMPDDAEWDPADVRYNTIRWSNTFQNGILGVGPSRTNPLTGEILDADVLIDASAARVIQESSDLLIQNQLTPAVAIAPPLCDSRLRSPYLQWLTAQGRGPGAANVSWRQLTSPSNLPGHDQDVCFGLGATREMAYGALSLAVMQNVLPSSEEMQDYVHQFLRWLTAHEVGHVLGLRHNFRGSTMLNPADLNNAEVTQNRGLVGSVMDYVPVNLASPGQSQGDYFPSRLGPYDIWAIEYGYKWISAGTPRAEIRQLEQIAQRASEPGLAYATDEDSMDFLDTEATVWDMSSNMLSYSQLQLENVRTIWERLERRYPLPGESYSELRDRFNTVFDYYRQQVFNLTRYIGGQRFNRDRYGDPGGRLPFEFTPIEQQRDALTTLQNYVFSADAFQFSPDLLNRLAPTRWYHWGSSPPDFRLDYPVYDSILFVQTLILSDLLSSDRLARLRDAELRANPGEVLTLPELFDSLNASIWTEVLSSNSGGTISSLRRGLQRQHLDILVNMVLQNTAILDRPTNFSDFIAALFTVDAPDDARVLARHHLQNLRRMVNRALDRSSDLDTATQAHLEAVSDRISKALDAPLQAQ